MGFKIATKKKDGKTIDVFNTTHILSQNTRLAIMVTMISKKRIIFTELQKILEITPGNLDSHLKKLENQFYIRIRKTLINNSPRTIVIITNEGFRSTLTYISKLKSTLESYIKKE